MLPAIVMARALEALGAMGMVSELRKSKLEIPIFLWRGPLISIYQQKDNVFNWDHYNYEY